MKQLLKKDSNISRIIGNLMDKPELEYPEYKGQFKFMNPINSLLKDSNVIMYKKKALNEIIHNYSKILLGNEFLEAYEMLFRNTEGLLIEINKSSHKTYKLTKSKL